MIDHPVATCLLAPSPPDDQPGRRHRPSDPNACRIIRVAVAMDDEWPWRRLTGIAADVPSQWTDLDAAGWRVQPLWQVAQVYGHEEER